MLFCISKAGFTLKTLVLETQAYQQPAGLSAKSTQHTMMDRAVPPKARPKRPASFWL